MLDHEELALHCVGLIHPPESGTPRRYRAGARLAGHRYRSASRNRPQDREQSMKEKRFRIQGSCLSFFSAA